jgi:hypothetical protein
MVAVADVAELMNHGVLQHRPGREDQMPVQVYDAVSPTASPEMFLILDANRLGLEAIRLPMLAHESGNVLSQALAQP